MMKPSYYQRIVNRVRRVVLRHDCFMWKKSKYGIWFIAENRNSDPFLEVAIAPNGTFSTRYLTPDAHRKYKVLKTEIIEAINSDERSMRG